MKLTKKARKKDLTGVNLNSLKRIIFKWMVKVHDLEQRVKALERRKK